MEEHCGMMIHMIMDSVYQIRLQLDDIYIQSVQSSATCQTEIEPWYTWPNLMLYFENLDLDCDLGYLQFFQSTTNSTRVTGLEDDICGNVQPPGVFLLDNERYLQIRYVARRNQYLEDAFSVIITSYADEPCPDHSFKCDNSRCIDREIRCDGYDSCGDGSGCKFDLSSAAIAAIIICSLVGLFILISTVICVVCFVRKTRKSQERAESHAQPGVVYTVTASGNGTLSPPSYNSEQNGQIRSNDPNPASHTTVRSNFTMPVCQQDTFRNPPPYEEMQNSLQGNIDSMYMRENTGNDVLENVDTTDISAAGETDRTKEETPNKSKIISELPVDEINFDVMEQNTKSDDTDHIEDVTYEIISHAADVPTTDKVSNEHEESVKECAYTVQRKPANECDIKAANSYTNPFYSEEYNTVRSADALESKVMSADTVTCENTEADQTEEANYENISDCFEDHNTKQHEKDSFT